MARSDRWIRRLALLALAAQVAVGCRSVGRRLATWVPDRPAATLTALPTNVTAPASATPSPQAAPTQAPSVTRAPGGTEESTADVSATLGSLEKVDDYPLYTMRYHGPYGQAASSARTTEYVRHSPPIDHWACSLFAALGDADGRLYGRNFDWRYSPALLLFTDPPDGYASVSMVDIAYLVDTSQVQSLTDLPARERRPLLEAPFWPFDGMNEQGLVVGMAAVPESAMPHDPSRRTIGSLGVIREMLDHARDVEEAIAILDRYNIAWEGGPALHYLIADASGHSILVEFHAGEMHLIARSAGSRWQLATNHLRALVDKGDQSGCARYDLIEDRLSRTDGRLGISDAMDLLADVAQEETQWSVVYDLSARGVHVVMGGSYANRHRFMLKSDAVGGKVTPG